MNSNILEEHSEVLQTFKNSATNDINQSTDLKNVVEKSDIAIDETNSDTPVEDYSNYQFKKKQQRRFVKREKVWYHTGMLTKIALSGTNTGTGTPSYPTPFSVFLWWSFFVLGLGIIAMVTYGLINGIVVFSFWNYALATGPNSAMSLPFVNDLKPVYFYQYFFFNTHTHSLTVDLPSSIEQSFNSTANAAVPSSYIVNYSISGFNTFSAQRFSSFTNLVLSTATHEVLLENNTVLSDSSLHYQIFWSAIIQIIYSLIGLLLTIGCFVSMSYVHRYKTKWWWLILLIAACIFIFI